VSFVKGFAAGPLELSEGRRPVTELQLPARLCRAGPCSGGTERGPALEVLAKQAERVYYGPSESGESSAHHGIYKGSAETL
jgi:hypothetical protein